MNTRIVPATLLALTVSVAALAQTKDKEKTTTPKSKEEKEVIIKKDNGDEKTVIVIDGNRITINGKPIEYLKGEDMKMLRDKAMVMAPRLKSRLAPMMNGMRMFSDGSPITGNRAFLGVVTEKNEKGAKINSVEKESAAEKAGLKKDDVITKLGDAKIEGADDLVEAIGKYKPEDKVTVTYLRDGKQATANAVLGKNPSSNMKVFNFNNEDFNMDMPKMKEFNFEMPEGRTYNRDFNFTYSRKPKLGLEIQDLEEGKGVKILGVDEDSPAAKAGLKKDDVVTELDGAAVDSVDDLRSKLKDKKEGDSFKLSFKRNGSSQTADIRFPKKLKTADL